MSNNKIHATAIIHPSAKLAKDVEVGPYSVIGADVEIGEGTWIGPHVVVSGPSKIGKNNKFFQFSSIGESPQDLSYKGEPTRLEMGDNNIVRECVTIHRGTMKDKGITKIGSHNLLMAYAHIAHDCIVHNHTIFSNHATLAGHVEIRDYAIIGAFCAIHQGSRIGESSFITRSCLIPRDVPPYLLVTGPVAKVSGLNQVGLERRGFSAEAIKKLWQAYKILYRESLLLADAISKLKELSHDSAELQHMVEFIEQADQKRGILRVSNGETGE
jgi:UDP-N-acetylglucosamine acyltransferase